MTVWAMLMVEIVNPTVKDMQEKRLGREKAMLRQMFSIVFPYI
jgi:ABC-type hemin transport system ATPase subunit